MTSVGMHALKSRLFCRVHFSGYPESDMNKIDVAMLFLARCKHHRTVKQHLLQSMIISLLVNGTVRYVNGYEFAVLEFVYDCMCVGVYYVCYC